jgi:hypothetical protein
VTTDDLAAVRHLLRSLDNASALPDNALAGEMLQSLDVDHRRLCEDILNRVRRGLIALGERGGASGVIERKIRRR